MSLQLEFISSPTARYGPTTPFGLLYSINPAIIIIAVPFVMALTQRFDPLKQIKFGEVHMCCPLQCNPFNH